MSGGQPVRIVGICRFSYSGLGGGFKRNHENLAEREAHLYAPERMESRFRHFECLTLPSLAAQRDGDFSFVIVIGTTLPQPWRDRLHDLTAPVPQIRIVQKDVTRLNHHKALTSALKQELGANDTDSVQFRLDDDDAVSVHFIDRLRQAWTETAPIRADRPAVAVDFNSGHIVRLSRQGISARQVFPPFWSCALAAMFRPGAEDTVMTFPHHRIHTQMPALVCPDQEMFLRAAHHDNDSMADRAPGDGPLFDKLRPLTEEQRRQFREAFSVDEDFVRRRFSAPDGIRGRA